MKKILFIYGFGGKPETSSFKIYICEALPEDEYQVVCPMYPQEDATAARDLLHQVIAGEGIDLVVGTSLGGFLTLSLDTDLPRVVLNPCMIPSYELPLLPLRAEHPDDRKPSQELIDSYKVYEDGVNHGAYCKNSKVIGMFAVNDKTIQGDYKKDFKTYYNNVRTMPGSHHGNQEAIPAIIEAIKDALS